jgi:hypothetical protein
MPYRMSPRETAKLIERREATPCRKCKHPRCDHKFDVGCLAETRAGNICKCKDFKA